MLCSHCGIGEGRLLHPFRLGRVFRKVCTDCFLRLHPHAFCPTCYLVHKSESSVPNPSKDAVVTCYSCCSSSHNTCVGPVPSNPYICHLCTNPNSLLFVYNEEGGRRIINERADRVLLTATKISAEATDKVAAAAQVKALQKTQKAAFARRKAKAALENFWAIQEEADQAEKSVLTDLDSNDLSDIE